MSTIARHAGAVALLAAATSSLAGSDTVTPSGDAVPENLLRIELHLSRSLRRPLAMDHVHLIDADGVPIDGAFLDLPLPGDDGRTATLLLHPGRVKTGVGANLAMGRALRSGEEVELVVDDPQLAAPMRHRWRVTPQREQGLRVGDWRLTLPRAGTREPLSADTNATLTSSSARLIAVRGLHGERLVGEARLREGERTWEFRPARPWQAGGHALVVHPMLEDVAGNRACTPFEARALSMLPCDIVEQRFEPRR